MGSAERKTPFAFTVQPVTTEWLDRQRVLNSTEVRDRVGSMMERGAKEVLGEDLEQQVASQLHINVTGYRDVLKGSAAIRYAYSPTVASIARGLGWDEGNAQLSLLSTSAYGHLLGQRIVTLQETDADITSLTTLSERIRTTAGNFVTKKEMSPEDVEEVSLLAQIFDLNGQQRTNILLRVRDANKRAVGYDMLRTKLNAKKK